MNERSGRPTDSELEAALRDAAAHLSFPPTADLVPAVRARIAAGQDGAPWRGLWSPRFALVPALATLVLLVLAALAFQPVATQAAEALGLRGLVIFRTAQTPPPATPSPSPSPRPTGASPTPPGGVLSDARLVASVDAASAEVGFTVVVPAALGAPDEVYVRVRSQDAQAFLVYRPRPGVPASAQTGIGVLVTEVKGSFDFGILGKVLGPGTKAEQLTVDGSPGVWIEGAPHDFFYRAPSGTFIQDTLRLSGNALVWTRGDLLIRLEADVTKDEALRLASSVP